MNCSILYYPSENESLQITLVHFPNSFRKLNENHLHIVGSKQLSTLYLLIAAF